MSERRCTDETNRLGAKQEGVLRNHYVCRDGYVRDSVYFSVIGSEWKDVKAHIETLMKKYNNSSSGD